jgi:hypothetical protein
MIIGGKNIDENGLKEVVGYNDSSAVIGKMHIHYTEYAYA